MTENTLASHLGKLKSSEKGFIMFVLNVTNILGYKVHLGMLPFVKTTTVMQALSETTTRTGAEIKAKLRPTIANPEVVTWTMQLSSAKVARRFGAHPERGHKIPGLTKSKKVTVGVRWSLPKKDFEPDTDVLVHPHLILKPLQGKHQMWQITCERIYERHVSTWLMDYCR